MLSERSVAGVWLPIGKKLSHSRCGVIPAAVHAITATTTAMRISRPAMSGPDPVRDREGIDIGFLERTSARPHERERASNEVSPSEDGRRPCRGPGRA